VRVNWRGGLYCGEGKTLLEEYDLKGSDKWGQLGALVLFFIVFFFFALLALTKVNHSRR
jgi:hypothetical protein